MLSEKIASEFTHIIGMTFSQTMSIRTYYDRHTDTPARNETRIETPCAIGKAIIENVFLIAITESYLRDEIFDAEFFFNGFQ